jgi:hypothetical protein
MQITGLPEEADDDTPITLLLTKEEPVNYDEPEDPATVQVINGKFFYLFFSFFFANLNKKFCLNKYF